MTDDASDKLLPTAAFVVLAMLAEGDAHGYELQRQAWSRGFRYWTDASRSSIYGGLKKLVARGLAQSRYEEGDGPPRKVYSITDAGRRRLSEDARTHLACPDHPRNEIDLGVYALPFVGRDDALDALAEGLAMFEGRNGFLEERVRWCTDHGLDLPRLAFERALASSRVNERWLRELHAAIAEGRIDVSRPQWAEYEYRQPPEPRVPDDTPP